MSKTDCNIDIRKILAEQASEVETKRAMEILARPERDVEVIVMLADAVEFWAERCKQAERKLRLIQKEIVDYDQTDKSDPDFAFDIIALMLAAREVE